MKIVDKLFGIFGYQKAVGRAFTIPVDPMVESMGQPTKQNYKSYLKQYADAPWVYSCIYRISSKGAGVPLKLYKKTIKNGKLSYAEIIDHPIVTLINKANPFMTGEDLKEATLAYEELTGNSYWLLDKFIGGKPTEIYPLRPDRITVIPDAKNYISGYKYDLGYGKHLTFKPEQILHFKYFNSGDDFYGLSPLAAGKLAVETQKFADTYNRNFFTNSARPGGVFVAPAELTEDQKKRIGASWKQLHQGVGNAHKTAIMEGGLDWKAVGLSQKDMDFVNSKRLTREDILGVFGVPPAMVGIFEYANYANTKEQREIFWRDTMMPKLAKIAAVINSFLVQPWDNTLEAKFDFSNIDALKKDEKLRAETDKILTGSGIKTINEAREERGLAPVAWGDTWNAPQNVGPIITEKPGEEKTPKKPTEEEIQADVKKAIYEVRKQKDIQDKLINWKQKATKLKAKNQYRQRLQAVLENDTHDEDFDLGDESDRVEHDPIIRQEEEEDQAKAIRDKKWEIYKDLTEDWEKKFHPILRKFFSQQEQKVFINLEDVGWKRLAVRVRMSKKENRKQPIDDIIFDINDANKEARKISKPIIEGSLEANGKRELATLGIAIAFDINNPEVQEWIKNKQFKFAKNINTTTAEALRTQLDAAVTAGESVEQVEDRIRHIFDVAKGPRTELIARTEVISATNRGAFMAYKQAKLKKKEWISSRDADVRDEHKIDGEQRNINETFSNGLMHPGDLTGQAGNIINCRCTMSGVTT